MRKSLALAALLGGLLISTESFGQLSGVVKHGDNALPGVTIQLLENEQGVFTAADGTFYFDIPKGSYQLEIRSVGFKVRQLQVEVPHQKTLEIQLEESTLPIDEVVVTGTLQPTFITRSPVKVDVITAKYLNNYTPSASTSIVEAISLVNGVQEVVSCGVCFTNSISINGLPGPYTAILMDGSPIYGNLASVYGLNGIPSMIIDRIEVIKGPNSTLYGSEAVAGVINIITKDPKNQSPFSIDIMGTSHLETFGNLTFTPRVGKTIGLTGVNYAYINNFDDENGDGFGDIINLDRVSIFSKWNINRKSGKTFSITGKYYYEDRRNGVEAFLQNRNYRSLRGSDQIYGESIFTNRLEIFGTYEFVGLPLRLDYSLSRHLQDSYYGADYYKASQEILFTNLIWQHSVRHHSITGGFTSRYQTYDDNTIATQINGKNKHDVQYIPGVFLQNEWVLNERFTTLGGFRLDHYKDHGFIPAPRWSAKYKPGTWTTLRANFGTGFRIVNLFTEDHAFVTGQREVIIEESLQPEESYNFSLNANHLFTIGESQGMIDLDAFYTYFSNKITPDYDIEGEIRYANSEGHSISKGIGINLQQEFSFPISYNLGLNIQQVQEYERNDTRNIEFAPRWTGIFTFNYKLKNYKINIGYTTNITGPMSLPEVYDIDPSGQPEQQSRPTLSKSFALHNLQVSKDMNGRLNVYGGIQNIFNYTQPWSPLVGLNDPNSNPGFSDRFDTAYAYSPIHGREYFVGLKWAY